MNDEKYEWTICEKTGACEMPCAFSIHLAFFSLDLPNEKDLGDAVFCLLIEKRCCPSAVEIASPAVSRPWPALANASIA
jgi:hypothetical protein